MRKLLGVLLLALVVLGVVGCGAGRKRYEAGLRSLVGQHIDDFARSWGPANHWTRLSNGNVIMVWRKSDAHTTPEFEMPNYQQVYTPYGSYGVMGSKTYGGKRRVDTCEVRVEFSQTGYAEDIGYQGDAVCKDFFPVPEVDY